MTQQEVYILMESSKSVKEWNENIEKVKAEFDDEYPTFWYKSIVLSGLFDRISKTVEE